MPDAARCHVIQRNDWSYVADGDLEISGPWRYRWEAQEVALEMNRSQEKKEPSMISQKEFDDAMADLVKAEAEIDELRKIRDGCERIMLGRKAEIGRLQAESAELQAALAPMAALQLWRDIYPDAAIDTLVDRNLASYFTPDQVRRARELIADGQFRR
jgi:predicted phage gp36 major capsid-like protein